MSAELVVKSNHVIEASYRLTLNEQRLILMCIQTIKHKQSLSEEDSFTLHARDFAKTFGVSQGRAYSELQIVAERLYERSVTIYCPDPNKPKLTSTRTRWVSSIDYMDTEGALTLHFAKKMIPYISMLEGGFTRYSLENVSRMKSSYGIRFYEFFKSWLFGETKGNREVPITDLKSMLDLETKYPAIKDFKLNVLDKAIFDINTFSDLKASYSCRKTGKRITHVKFQYELKSQNKKSVARKFKIDNAYIEKHARPGETYQEAASRLKLGL